MPDNTKDVREREGGGEILALLIRMQDQLHDVRERLIRLESHGYGEALAEVKMKTDDNTIRITVLETKGSIFAAGVAAAVSIGVSLVSAALLYLFKLPH